MSIQFKILKGVWEKIFNKELTAQMVNLNCSLVEINLEFNFKKIT